jgi:pantoate--beta-alanine ligase
MRVLHTIAELTEARDELRDRRPQPTIALVPTMGALHAGHRSLFALAHTLADVVVVSIFVNPLQFGPDEDYARYPRTPEADLEACRSEGIDLVFTPSVAELYPAGRQVSVQAGLLGTVFEGRSRPGHFDGVVTVQSKLINLVQPDKVIFGQQDAQQLAVVRKMAADLNCDVDIVGGPTVRDADGLALSSRNRYLLPQQRTSALALSAALRAARGHDDVAGALSAAGEVLQRAEHDSTFRLDYLNVVHPHTFAELRPDHTGEGLMVVAAWVGDVRLIDNATMAFTSRADAADAGRLDRAAAY